MGIPHPIVDAPSSTLPLPRLTAQDVADQTDHGSYSRGRDYRRQEAIRQPIRRGRTLSALCRGSQPAPYQVRATLSDPIATGEKIVTCACTCPRGGFCKHVVALLLTWIEDPDAFEVLPTTDETLADQSRDDLLRLIGQMLEHDPSLESLVDRLKPVAPLPPAAPGEARLRTVNQAAFRRKVALAIEEASNPYGGYGGYDSYGEYGGGETGYLEALARLREFVAQGLMFKKTGRIADAVVVFSTIVEEILTYGDENEIDDAFAGIALDCGIGLLDCLEQQAAMPGSDRLDAADRTTLVESLYNVWSIVGGSGWGEENADDQAEDDAEGEIDLVQDSLRFVTDRGGRDSEAAIATALTEEERARYESWLRDLLTATSAGNPHIKRDAIRFLFKLRPDQGGGEEALLDAYKGAELWDDAASLLLTMGRIDEAVALAGRHLTTPTRTLTFADRLYAFGGDGAARAVRFVADRLWETEGVKPRDDLVYLDWLSGRYAAQGMPQQAFEMERRRFKQAPAFRFYTTVKEAALRPGLEPDLWEKTRPQLIDELTRNRLWGTLIEIYLHEDQVAEAIAALKEMERPRDRREQAGSALGADLWLYAGMGSGQYRISVAKAAERDFPEEAIRLYRSLAEAAINGRNRQSYATAATYLVSVRNLMEQIGQETEWRTYIAGLRDEHRRLRALKEELDAQGLR